MGEVAGARHRLTGDERVAGSGIAGDHLAAFDPDPLDERRHARRIRIRARGRLAGG